jgi:hypothetical protein
MSDFDAILNVVNGDLRNDNISPSAAIAASKLAGIPGSQIIFSRGTTPPASPQDGDLWQYAADATNGVYWMFRYNAGSASAYKWEYLGGSPLRIEQTADMVLNNAAWIDATGIGTLALPRAGDWRLSHFGRVYFSGSVAWGGGQTLRLGAAAAAAAEQYNVNGPNPASAGTGGYGRRDLVRTGLASGLVLTMAHTTGGGQGVGFTERAIEVIPIRIS